MTSYDPENESLRIWLEDFLKTATLERRSPETRDLRSWLPNFLLSQASFEKTESNQIIAVQATSLQEDDWRIVNEVLEAQLSQRASSSPINVWSLARIGRNELRNAHIVAWLLSPAGSHGRGSAFLQAFADLLNSCSNRNKIAPADYYKSLVRTEEYPIGSTENRVDIEIIGDNFLLIVEVKIDAPEGAHQLERYMSLIEKKSKAINRENFTIAFLSSKKPSIETDKLTWVTWKKFSRLAKTVAFGMPKGSLARQLVAQFASHANSL